MVVAWTLFEGERWVLVAYVPEAFRRLGNDFIQPLYDLDFPVSVLCQSRVVQLLPRHVDDDVARSVPIVGANRAVSDAPVSHHDDRSLAELLVAARPVVWRGAGDLLQVPWLAVRRAAGSSSISSQATQGSVLLRFRQVSTFGHWLLKETRELARLPPPLCLALYMYPMFPLWRWMLYFLFFGGDGHVVS